MTFNRRILSDGTRPITTQTTASHSVGRAAARTVCTGEPYGVRTPAQAPER